jgi:hypothetical protein
MAYDIHDVETGDEIHLPNGDVWSVTTHECGSVSLGISIVLGSFADNPHGFAPAYGEEFPCSDSTKGIFEAVLMAPGTRLVKGVGVIRASKDGGE